jgi:hypothetical protein
LIRFPGRALFDAMKTLLSALVLAVAASAALAADPVSFQVGEFTFQRPADWAWNPSNSPMRKAQLAVTGPDGAVGEVVFFHFGPGQGGSVADNVRRWLAQFQNPSSSTSETESISGRNVTFVAASGTFLSGMPGTPPIPLDGYGLRGAILESPQGDVYVKLTGPQGVVDAASPAFESMVRKALK